MTEETNAEKIEETADAARGDETPRGEPAPAMTRRLRAASAWRISRFFTVIRAAPWCAAIRSPR